LEKYRGKIEILIIHNVLCRNFVAACRAIAASCRVTFLTHDAAK